MCVRRLWVLPEPSSQRNQLEDLGDLRVPCSGAGGPSFLPKEGLFLCPAPPNPHLPEEGNLASAFRELQASWGQTWALVTR